MEQNLSLFLKQKIFFRRLIQLIILGGIFLMAITPIRIENDLFWQLKMGEQIVDKHYFPIADPFSSTARGGVWTLEEWLPGSVFYILYKNYGTAVLIILKAFIITLTFGIFFVLFNKQKVNLYLSFLIFLLAALVNTRVIWGVFPSIFEYLFLSLTLFILESSKKYTWKGSIIQLSLLSLIWANSHGSFFLQTFILLSYIFGSITAWLIKAFFPNYHPAGKILSLADMRKLSVAGLASIVAPFLTPNGYWTFIYPFRISFGKFTGYISEYQHYWSIWNWNFNDFVHGFTFVLIMFMVLLFTISWRKLNPIDLFLAFIFTLLALTAVRHVAIFALVALLVCTHYIKSWFGEYRGFFKRSLFKDLLIILFMVCLVYWYKTNVAEFGLSLSEDTYPKQAAEFVMNNKITGNMFNHYNYGGYLIWKMPEYKVFIDGRLEMYLGQIGQDYLSILETPNYKNLLNKYQVNFIIEYKTDRLIDKLLKDKDYKLVFNEGQYVVFVSNLSKNQEVIKRFWSKEKENSFTREYNQELARMINEQAIGLLQKGEFISAIANLEEASQRDPDSMPIRFNLAKAYTRAGWFGAAKQEYQEILKIMPENTQAKAGLDNAKKVEAIMATKSL